MKDLVLFEYFLPIFNACLKPCSRIFGTEGSGDLGNMALMCFSVVLG